MDENCIYYVEWECSSDERSTQSSSAIETQFYYNDDGTGESKVCCKHCSKEFKSDDAHSMKFHMKRIHPQVRTDMTFDGYLKEFEPRYLPGAHGPEKGMEASFSIDLRKYVLCPETYQEVLYYDEIATLITDKFPKSEVHVLVLPRSYSVSSSHPKLMDAIKPKLEWHIELAKQYCWTKFNKKYEFEEEMTKSVFVSKYIQCGIHSVPSMSNAHVHVMTKDFHSDRMKNKKHFNSFNSPFFVEWEDLPKPDLPSDAELTSKYIKNYDMICPYCSANFKNQFSKLKKHLDEEFIKRFTAKST